MENADAPFDLLNLIADVSLEEIERQIDYHSQQVDCLRLLRQIVEIRQEQGPSPAPVAFVPNDPADFIDSSSAGPAVVKRHRRLSPTSPKAGIMVAGSLADRIRLALESGEEKSPQQLFAEVGGAYVEDVYKVLNRWRGKLFEKVGKNWRLISEDARPTRIVEEMYPRAGSIMSGVVDALRDGSVLSVKELRERVGRGAFTEYYRGLKLFEARGLFERVGKNWRLANAKPANEASEPADSVEKTEPPASVRIEAPAVESGPPATTGILEHNRQRVANYLEFNQPAKPTTIAIDTGLDVVDVLAALECDQFEKADRGWIRARQCGRLMREGN